jgi:HEAT repeat protein
MNELLLRSTDAEVRRSIMFAVANTRWPDRQAMIRQTLEAATGGVLGAALDAAAVHPDASFLPAIRELLAEEPDASPQLIDAVGAVGDAESIPQLLGWLKRERNPAVRMKIILAINRIPGDAAARVLTELLANVAEPLEADLLCRIAGRRSLPGAARFLAGLGEDVTAPVAIRGQAIWALGNYADADARESLRRLTADTPKYFPDLAAGRLIPEQLEQARLFIDLARLRQGDKAAAAEVVRGFRAATPATQVSVLRSLAQINLDSPAISDGLKSGDFAVLEAAVRAARACDPSTHAAELAAIRKSPFIAALLASGLDTWNLSAALRDPPAAAPAPSTPPSP